MMNEQELTATLEKLKQDSPKKFKQSFDLIFALKELDLKKPEEQVELFVQVHKSLGRKLKICALVGPEMVDDCRKVFDLTVQASEFDAMKKPQLKRIAQEHDFFIAQANIMPKIAQTWGRILGPKGKMPNPKAGCVIPPKTPIAVLTGLFEKLQKTLKISVKKSPSIQVLIGKEDMATAEVVDNIKTVYDQVLHHLPKEQNNLRHVFVKLTMSKPVRIH